MKKEYETPEMKLTVCANLDVLTLSPGSEGDTDIDLPIMSSPKSLIFQAFL